MNAASNEKDVLRRDMAGAARKRWTKWLWIVGSIALLAIGAVVAYQKTRPEPVSKYVTAEVTTGDVVENVQSTGQVKPLTEVQIGAQVSGRITNVYVDFNSTVKKGDVLAEIDQTLFGAQIDSNQAQLASAKAALTRAEANVVTSKQKLERAQKLVREGIGSQADLDLAQGTYEVALADASAARAQINQIHAVLRSSRTNMDYTRILSPIDGVVVNRAIDPGQTVAASFQAPTLFVIAQDLKKMRVLADIDEADVGKLKDNMTAQVSVDAFPGETFKGRVSQVRYNAQTVSGVVTYAAVIEVDNPELKLRPGMTATVIIRANEALGTTRIANAALRFKPTPPTDKDGKKLPQEPLPSLGPHQGRLYVVTDTTLGNEKIEPRIVEIGITDGAHTVLKTDLKGQKIVIDETDEAATKKARTPRMF